VTARRVLVRAAVLAVALLGSSAAAPATATDESTTLQRQWAIAAGPAVKIEVRRNGWYRVSRSRLARSGANFSSPRRLRLYADGKEVPIHVGGGAIAFYGLARDTPSTDERTYWLVDGAPGGRRIRVALARTDRRTGFAQSFPFTLERKYRTIYSTLQNGGRQNYFGDMVYANPTTLQVMARDVARRTGSLEVVLQGLSKRSHQVKIVLNGAALGTMAFRSQANVARRFRLPPGLLRDGANSLTLTSVADRTSPVQRGKWVMEVLLGSPPPPG